MDKVDSSSALIYYDGTITLNYSSWPDISVVHLEWSE